jgi:transcriptional regulator with XRE-family HTH domain
MFAGGAQDFFVRRWTAVISDSAPSIRATTRSDDQTTAQAWDGQPAMADRASQRGLVTPEQQAFGSRLRSERERRGIDLGAIASATKIKESLLAELERSDVSHWPAGIFRRAFFREYVGAIGMPVEPLVSEFTRLFPENGSPDVLAETVDDEPNGLRLTLAGDERRRLASAALRIGSALLDLALVLAAARGLSFLSPGNSNVWALTGVVALIYYSMATCSGGRTAASWHLLGAFSSQTGPRSRMQAPQTPHPRDVLRLVARQPLSTSLHAADDLTLESPSERRAKSN